MISGINKEFLFFCTGLLLKTGTVRALYQTLDQFGLLPRRRSRADRCPFSGDAQVRSSSALAGEETLMSGQGGAGFSVQCPPFPSVQRVRISAPPRRPPAPPPPGGRDPGPGELLPLTGRPAQPPSQGLKPHFGPWGPYPRRENTAETHRPAPGPPAPHRTPPRSSRGRDGSPRRGAEPGGPSFPPSLPHAQGRASGSEPAGSPVHGSAGGRRQPPQPPSRHTRWGPARRGSCAARQRLRQPGGGGR